jgi:uncharacterized SAM-binding protein YcdF (DUF218 family)
MLLFSIFLMLVGIILIIFATAMYMIGALIFLIGLLLFLSRWWRRLMFLFLGLGMVGLLFSEVPIFWASRGDFDKKAQSLKESPTSSYSYEYVIVPGASVYGRKASPALTERMQAALRLLSANDQSKVVCSGGQGSGEDISEAACMANFFKAQGISPDRIILDDQSSSTKENLENSFALIEKDCGADLTDKKEAPVIVVCSSEYHLFRIRYLAKRLGVQISTYPASTRNILTRINYFLYEVPASFKAFITSCQAPSVSGSYSMV